MRMNVRVDILDTGMCYIYFYSSIYKLYML